MNPSYPDNCPNPEFDPVPQPNSASNYTTGNWRSVDDYTIWADDHFIGSVNMMALGAKVNCQLMASGPDLLETLKGIDLALTGLLCSREIDSTTPLFYAIKAQRDSARCCIGRAQRPSMPMDGQGDCAEQRDYYRERGKGLN